MTQEQDSLGDMVPESDRTPALCWDRLTGMSVCFGHQSVGNAIVKALATLSGQRMGVVETEHPQEYRSPIFGHFRVGRNGDPFSKCQAFARIIESGVGDRVDVAMFKFCYVDVTSNTDVEALFRGYHEMMKSLMDKHPKVTFLHITVPLRQVTRGLRGWMDEWSGRSNPERKDQAKRHAFNQLLRRAYDDGGCLYDLAEVEATFPDGSPSFFIDQGDAVPTLVPEYTDDGGHLNRHAAELAARRLLECLSAVRTEI